MRLINLDDLNTRIEQLNKPVPQDVINLIMQMYKELK